MWALNHAQPVDACVLDFVGQKQAGRTVERVVVVWVGRADQYGTLAQFYVNVAAEVQRAGEVASDTEHQRAAALFSQIVDGRLDAPCVESGAV